MVRVFAGHQVYDEHHVPEGVGDRVVPVVPDGGRKLEGEELVPASVHLDMAVG